MQTATHDPRTIARTHLGFVMSLAIRLCPVPGAAEDIAQEVCAEFIANGEKWDLSRNVEPLLAGITRNMARRHWRRRARNLSAGAREIAEIIRARAGEVEVTWYGEEEKNALRTCIDKLPDRGHRLVHARYFQELSAEEIGSRLSMRAVAVRNAMLRLRARLRACIERMIGRES